MTRSNVSVSGDYLGVDKADIAVFRPSNGTWYVKDGPTVSYGTSGDIPVVGSYDTDTAADGGVPPVERHLVRRRRPRHLLAAPTATSRPRCPLPSR